MHSISRYFFKSGTVLATLLLLVLATACVHNRSGQQSASTPQQAVLRVGVTPDARPMSFLDRGVVSGLEADFAKGLAKATHRRLQFVQLKWEEQIPALLAGKTDIIMSAMTITAGRSYQISFSKPYMITGQVSLVRVKDQSRFGTGFSDLLNPMIRVGVIRGTSGDLLISSSKNSEGIARYGNADQAVNALFDHDIDAFVYDLPMNFYLGALYADKGLMPITTPLSREQLAWGIRKNDTELLASANSYLAGLKKNGQLEKMVIRWIPFYTSVYNAQ